MKRFTRLQNLTALAAACVCAAIAPADGSRALAAEPVSFRSQVAPILIKSCIACHGPKNAKGNYRLDSFALAVGSGGASSAAFVAGDVEGSEAFRRITSDDPEERMPLDADPLTADEIELVRQWIAAGTLFDGSNPKAALASIVPPRQYADPPADYPRPLPVTALAFNSAGDELFASGYHEITVWNPADGRLGRRIKNMPERTLGVTLAPDGKLLASAGGSPGQSGEVRLIDPATGSIVRVLNSSSDVVYGAAFSPTGDRLAAAGADGTIRVFDVATGEQQLSIESHADWVVALTWSRDGSRIASAARDKSAKVFDAKTGELAAVYSGHGAGLGSRIQFGRQRGIFGRRRSQDPELDRGRSQENGRPDHAGRRVAAAIGQRRIAVRTRGRYGPASVGSQNACDDPRFRRAGRRRGTDRLSAIAGPPCGAKRAIGRRQS